MAKSRTRAKADKAEIVGRRNLIINGAMQVWQRGTSFDVTGSTYTTDRWQGRDAVLSQSTDVPANEGFRYSAFYDNDGTRSAINFRQIVEDGKLYTDNKEITLSFWVKGSVASSGCTVDFGDQQYTSFPLTTEWNRVTLTVPSYVRNTSNLFNGGLYIDWNFGADYPDVYITGVQLELGSVATDFEHRSYSEELALCQRYYYHSGGKNTAPNVNTDPPTTGTHCLVVDMEDSGVPSGAFATEMRATPTITFGRLYTYNWSIFKAVTSVSANPRGIYRVVHDGGYVLGRPYWFAYTADAEL